MPNVRDLIKDIRAQARGETPMVKQASEGSSLDSLSPAQLSTLADRIEKSGQLQEASRQIVDMQKESSTPQHVTEMQMKKMAYQAALRELGFPRGSVSAVDLLFGDMQQAQESLVKWAADAATTLISSAVQMGLSDEQEEAPSE